MDTELRTPVMDMSTFNRAKIEFKTDFYYYSYGVSEIADVDVSVIGATGPWLNVWRKAVEYRGPNTEVVDITAIVAGQSNVMIRFHYYNAYWDWWWQIDDVHIVGTTEGQCAPPIRILGSSSVYYPSLQDAYDVSTDGETIQCQDTSISEDLYIDINKAVTVEGGYDCGYTTPTGKTTLNGNMTIYDGTLTIKNFVLQP